MILKICATTQKILIFHVVGMQCLIPGSIQIEIQASKSDNIPRMRAAIALAGDVPAIYAQFQRKAIEQNRKALANSRAMDHSCISRMLQIICGVIQIFVIIGHIGADPIIDSLDLLIFRGLI